MTPDVVSLLVAACWVLSILAAVSLKVDLKRKQQFDQKRADLLHIQEPPPLRGFSAPYARGWMWGRSLVLAVPFVTLACLWWYWQNSSPSAPPAATPNQERGQGVDTAFRSPLSADAIFAQASPAVVQVVIQDRQGRPVSEGSGFLVSGNGLFATNYHVIEKAHTAHVVLADKTKASVAGAAALDQEADIAIIKVAGVVDAQPLELAGNDLPPVGTRVFAIGNPLGLTHTLSDGLVSGHREFDRSTMIQTTAPISPGSSGGPLLGADGKVVGVTTLVVRGGQNLNLAVPVSNVARLLCRCENERELARFPLARQPATGQWVTEPARPSSKDAKAVELIKKFLAPGMTSEQVVWVIDSAADKVGVRVGWLQVRTGPRTFVVRYFPYEGSRGPGLTGLRYRLHVTYVNDRLCDWRVEKD
jgi:S1-C subfamily serine protease